MKKLFRKEIIFICIISILITIGTVIGFTHASASDPTQVVAVTPETTHTYTITVGFDGKNDWGNTLTYNREIYMRSNRIHVEDKLPYGLDFIDFVRNTSTNYTTIKAHRRLSTTSCDGYVSKTNQQNDEYNYLGVNYNPDTRVISFDVLNLAAGCVIEVKYKVTVPQTDDPLTSLIETQRDYYNVVKATSTGYTYYSNYVDLQDYNGTIPTTYQVTYEYTGDVPEGAPIIPSAQTFTPNAIVDVLSSPSLKDYDFSGWTSAQVTIDNNGRFTMPSNDVHFVGHFTPKQKYNVSYEIEGEIPEGYLVPKTKGFIPGEVVKTIVDRNTLYNGTYSINEWTSTDVEIDEYGTFVMPDHDVVLKGHFTQKRVYVNIQLIGEFANEDYDLYYLYMDGVSYICGNPAPTKVDLPTEFTSKYSVIKWQKVYDDEMNNSFGYEIWERYHNECSNYTLIAYFEPNRYIADVEVFLDVKNQQNSYQPGETVEYEITVKTNKSEADYIVLSKNLAGMTINPGEGYTVEGSNIIIRHMDARSTFKINATATMPNTGTQLKAKITREAATLPDDYILSDKNKEDEETVNRGATLTVCTDTDHILNDKVFQIQINGAESFATWLNLNPNNNYCKTVNVGLGLFIVEEIKPQEYTISSVDGVDVLYDNGGQVNLAPGDNKTVTIHNTLIQPSFLHGYGSVENTIPSSEMPALQPAQTSSIVFVSSYETNPDHQYMPDIKFADSKLDFNIIQYDRNRIVDGTYSIPGNCSYTTCPVPEGRTSDPYINHEYRFLGWSTEKQDQDHPRGYTLTNKVEFNNGVPTNLNLPEGDIIYLYAIYDNYNDGRTCSIAEINYHDFDDVDWINPMGYFDEADFTDTTYLSNDLRTNKVVYGVCDTNYTQGIQLILGEYHDLKPFSSIYPFNGWLYDAGGGSYRIREEYNDYIIGPPEPSNTYYEEMVKFGITNVRNSLVDNIIKYGIKYNNYVDPHYLRINVYGDGDGCRAC